MHQKVKLFANCIPVKGVNRSIICDLQRKQIKFIPNELFEILDKYESKSIEFIKKKYENKFDNIIDEYFDFLISNEFVFLTKTPELFPKLDRSWDTPFEITNSIMDLNSESSYDYISFLDQLEELNCRHLEIRFFDTSAKKLEIILQNIKHSHSIIHSVDVVASMKFEDFKYFEELIKIYPRLLSVTILDSDKNKIIFPVVQGRGEIVHSVQSIPSNNHCGKISTINFAVSIKNFTESLNHNSCLNRKISIDTEGNIKNCPSMSQSFGNIKDTTLQEALDHPSFKKYWNVTKEKIAVCKDCEFRYICTDCRAYLEDQENDLSKPLKCGYNPYTNKWEEWSTNPLKQKAIEFYGMQDLVKKDV